MERSRNGTGQPRSYGQACMPCYKAKCRCVPNPGGGDSCERCYRLKKTCQPSDSIRRRVGQRAEESDLRIAQLEGKIETLLSAIQSIANNSGSSVIDLSGLLSGENNNISSAPSSSSLADNNIQQQPYSAPSTGSSSVGNDGLTPLTDASPRTFQDTNPQSLAPTISPLRAGESLYFFRTRMLPCFPFLVLGPEITAQQLRQDRPILFHAIITVTTFSTQAKLVLIEEFKRLVFKHALVEVQSSIDLLLGLLAYLAWSTDAFLGGADLVSRLMMLAMSMVYDLRLFRPSQPDIQLIMAMTQGGSCESEQYRGEETVQAVMEKQRALLACFILSSNISSHLGRQDALRWTPQMEEACRIIERNKSSPTDVSFALQVRLHVLKQRAAYIREQHETDRARTATTVVTASIPGLLYLKTLLGQLRELTASFPEVVHQKDILIIYSHYVELYINHLAYSISLDSPLLNLSSQRSDGGFLPGFERLECLWRSVECIKTWLSKFDILSPDLLTGQPFHLWSQMILCVTVLKYLSTLADPAWDCQAVRRTVDMIPAMERMVQRLELVAASVPAGARGGTGGGSDDSLFTLLARLLSRCRDWAAAWWTLDAQQAPMANAEPCSWPAEDTGAMAHSGNYIPDLDQMVWLQSMDLESDQWLAGILGRSTNFA